MNGNLVTFPVHLLNGRVVGVFVGHEEGGLDVAAVGVLAVTVEDFFVQLDVVVVDGVIEGDGDHLRHIFGGQVARNGGSIFRTEAVWKDADRWVAGWRSVGVVVNIWKENDALYNYTL